MSSRAPIRVGNQTTFWVDPVEPFEYAIERRFDAFEFFPDRHSDGRGWSESDLSARVRASIRNAAQQHDITLSVHAARDASPLSVTGNERLLAQAEFAAEIGARAFVVHLLPAAALEQYAEAIATLESRLARQRIALAVENTPETPPSDINDMFRILRSGGQAAGICLDIGHANLCPGTRNDYIRYIDELATDTAIVHVHLHENRGDQDSHLTLFTGPAGRDAAGVETLVDRLARRRFSGCMILEQWPQPPELLDVARDRLLQIIAARSYASP